MIEAAEREGLLKSGGTIVEPTSGNTGVGLAIVAARRGYRCIFTMPDKIAQRVVLLHTYGAEVVVCPTAVDPNHPDSYYSVARAVGPRPRRVRTSRTSTPTPTILRARFRRQPTRRSGNRQQAASPTWWPVLGQEGPSRASAAT